MTRRECWVLLTLCFILAVLLADNLLVHGKLIGGTTERVSVNAMGEEGNGDSEFPAVSADGRFVAFSSSADNLVADDTNGLRDIFVVDRETGLVERVNVSSTGEQANGISGRWADISADGRFVTFYSIASNLVKSDTNGFYDIFVHDRWLGLTELISLSSSGNLGNGNSRHPAISADGRYVVYDSDAYNLVPNPPTSGKNVYLRDRETGETELISINAKGEQGNSSDLDPSVSSDGRFVAYAANSTNLIHEDTMDSNYDVYIHDRQLGINEKIWAYNGQESDGNSFSPLISGNGQFILFTSLATNLLSNKPLAVIFHVFLYDREEQTISRISQNPEGGPLYSDSFASAITEHGTFIVFSTSSDNYLPEDNNGEPDVFVLHRPTGWKHRVSVSTSGEEGNDLSASGAISTDGGQIAFYSDADNLINDDGNLSRDIFMHRWQLFNHFLPITTNQ